MPTPPSTRALVLSVPLSLAFAFSGCWTAPRADFHPPAVSHLVVDHILVHWNADTALVQEIDPKARTLRLARPLRRASELYAIAPRVSGFEHLRPGDRIRATLVDELSVYVPNAAITTTAFRLRPEFYPSIQRIGSSPSNFRMMVKNKPSKLTFT